MPPKTNQSPNTQSSNNQKTSVLPIPQFQSPYGPWQSAYSEYAFVEACWPDFTAEMFAQQVQGFGSRERRFGAVAG